MYKRQDEELTVFRRRKIGFIFQNYNLVPVLNVFENIVLPVELDGNKVDKKFMKEVVQMLGLEDKPVSYTHLSLAAVIAMRTVRCPSIPRR